MVQKDVIEVEGIVMEAMPGAVFRIQLIDQDHIILGHVSGKMRMYRIRLMPGDRVKIDMSPYDLSKGRITYRYKAGQKEAEIRAQEIADREAALHDESETATENKTE